MQMAGGTARESMWRYAPLPMGSGLSLEQGIELTRGFQAEGALLTDVGGTLPAKVLSTPGMISMMSAPAR